MTDTENTSKVRINRRLPLLTSDSDQLENLELNQQSLARHVLSLASQVFRLSKLATNFAILSTKGQAMNHCKATSHFCVQFFLNN